MKRESLIEEIYELKSNYEDIVNNKKSSELDSHIIDLDSKIRDGLADNKIMLENYKTVFSSLEDYADLNAHESYIEGFKYGFKLAMEIFDL